MEQNISVVKLEEYRDKVIIEDSTSKQYLVLPKNSKKVFTQDTLQANCSVKEIPDYFLNKTLSLYWKSVASKSVELKLPGQNDPGLVLESLENNVYLQQEELNSDGTNKKPGLRPPQIGAIYSILSNRAISNEPITVVLPTGTGKSESILGTIVAKKILRSLIIVPSDGLRNQFFLNCP